MREFNIAIDGPAGAGKSTVASLVANRLGFKYIDTGAMYRAVTWDVLQSNIALDDVETIARLVSEMDLVLEETAEGIRVLVNGENVTEAIRSQQVTSHVSKIAGISAVREILVRKQKKMAEAGGVVMDGRDIGTKVLPDAELKVFLTASIKERAERRFTEMKMKGLHTQLDQLEREIIQRDQWDSHRPVSPLKKAPDAVVIDTTGMSIEQVVEKILKLSRTKIGKVE